MAGVTPGFRGAALSLVLTKPLYLKFLKILFLLFDITPYTP
jgi:hypothetical protein